MRKFIYAASMILLLWGAFNAALNISGYCSVEKRWLSENERVLRAVETINNRDGFPVYEAGQGNQWYAKEKYSSAQELINRNPDCCGLIKDGRYGDGSPPPSLTKRLLRPIAGGVVTIKYSAEYVDKNGAKKTTQYRIQEALDNCGFTL